MASDFGKPENYPLPWCDALRAPYWRANMTLIFSRHGWKKHQRNRPMSELIPEIDGIIAERAA